MRTTSILVAFAVVLGAAPALATEPVFMLGSHLGVDVYRANDEVLTVVSATPPNGWGLVTQPGLRLGWYLPDQRLELATLLGMTMATSEGMVVRSVAADLEGNYYYGTKNADVAPYLGAHVGAVMLGYAEESETVTNVGLQLGVRRMVAGGHGAIRVELRGSVINSEYTGMTDIGLRIGYDLRLL